VAAVGDFEKDTAVAGGDGQYTATAIGDWRIWGPMGGYVAAIALRAAAAEVADGLSPASFTCQLLAPARFEPVDIAVTVRRASRRAALVAANITQDGVAILDSQTWFAVDADVVEHDHAKPHRFGHPDDHRDISELTNEEPRFPFWYNFDAKPVDWIPPEEFEQYQGGEPEWAEWARFKPRATFDDPVVEACRTLLLADLPSFPAATRAHAFGTVNWMSPSLDLAVQFHRVADIGDWLLSIGTAPVAHRGLLGFRSEVWNAAGLLVASGSGQLLCRSAPPQ